MNDVNLKSIIKWWVEVQVLHLPLLHQAQSKENVEKENGVKNMVMAMDANNGVEDGKEWVNNKD